MPWIGRLWFVALVLVAMAGTGCATIGVGRGKPPPVTAESARTWSITRMGERCFTRLLDCGRMGEAPGCPARRMGVVCPRDGEGRRAELSTSAAIHGRIGGVTCWLYAYDRDVPGYAKKGPARGPQSSKGARPNGKRWNPPPAVPPVAVGCPQG